MFVFQIKDKHVLVIGSTWPWVEAILLYLGVDRITTLEYASQNNEHPKINLVTPEELRKSILEGDVPQFDGMVTFSSLEHSGLGRYGDPLNPWGDLITMAQAWCLLKPGLYSLEIKKKTQKRFQRNQSFLMPFDSVDL